MNRAQAVAAVFEYVVNFAIRKARTAIEDEISGLPNEKLGYYEMSRTYDKVRDELHELKSFYCWGTHGIDHDRFVAARWALGEDYVNERIAEVLGTLTSETIQMLGQQKLNERKEEEAKKMEKMAQGEWEPVDG